MNITFHPTAAGLDRDGLQSSAVVVIDVLRATSSIIACVEGGASRIIPVESIATASRLVGHSDRGEKLLVGEHKGLPVEGFDLFNSPVDLTPERVGGRSVVIATTNGTPAIAAASAKAACVMVCSLTNVGAVAKKVSGAEDLVVLCCGSSGRLASEDILCGGILLDLLLDGRADSELDDAGALALFLARNIDLPLEEFLRRTDRGGELIRLGYEKDVVFCSRRDSSAMVPIVDQGAIVP